MCTYLHGSNNLRFLKPVMYWKMQVNFFFLLINKGIEWLFCFANIIHQQSKTSRFNNFIFKSTTQKYQQLEYKIREWEVSKCVSAIYSFAQAKFAKLQMFKVRDRSFLSFSSGSQGPCEQKTYY